MGYEAVGNSSGKEAFKKENRKYFLPLQGIESRFLKCPDSSLVTVIAEIVWLLILKCMANRILEISCIYITVLSLTHAAQRRVFTAGECNQVSWIIWRKRIFCPLVRTSTCTPIYQYGIKFDLLPFYTHLKGKAVLSFCSQTVVFILILLVRFVRKQINFKVYGITILKRRL